MEKTIQFKYIVYIMPDFSIEDKVQGMVAGVDEAGRGPWAGPVIAAAVIVNRADFPEGVDDSKKIKAEKRELLYKHIIETCQVGIGSSSAEEIDEINILQATMLAMKRAVENLPTLPHTALIDGNKAPKIQCNTVTIVKGDAKSLSIAAASIIAKVTRDRIMANLALEYPAYGWNTNSGYGTKIHQNALLQYGITAHHRKSYKPIAKIILENL